MDQVGICKLCAQTETLRNSHILPEFLYKDLYDDKGRMLGIRPIGGSQPKVLQKGLRERLLCDRCEGHFAELERYGAEILRNLPDTSEVGLGRVVFVPGVDYTKFKLFMLSLLWRAGVARGQSFAEVNLGPHERRIRELLNNLDPGHPLAYPCALLGARGGDELRGTLKLPVATRMQGIRSYILVHSGIIWVYLVASHTRELKQHRSFLSEDAKLPIHIATTASEFMREMGANLKRQGLLGK